MAWLSSWKVLAKRTAKKLRLCPTLCIVHNRAGCIRFRTVLEFVLEYVVVVAVVVVIVDVDDEEGEGGGEDAQRRKSNNPSLKGFLSCMNLYHIHIVRMQCCARCMFFRHSYGPFIASTLPLRKLMLRVDDRSRLYADALQRQF